MNAEFADYMADRVRDALAVLATAYRVDEATIAARLAGRVTDDVLRLIEGLEP